MSHEQNAAPNHNIKTGRGNESIESVVKFRYLKTSITNQNYICEKIMSRLNSGNACCCYIQHPLSSHLVSKIIKMNIYIRISLPVLYGCEAWSFTLSEEHMLRVYKNRVLSKIFGPKSLGAS
jgi:hypothetical protein